MEHWIFRALGYASMACIGLHLLVYCYEPTWYANSRRWRKANDVLAGIGFAFFLLSIVGFVSATVYEQMTDSLHARRGEEASNE